MIDFKKDIEEYYEREIAVINSLNKKELNRALNSILEHYNNETNIYVFGNGGSSATASHFVCDFNKGVCMNLEKKFRLQCLNDNVPTIMAVANDIAFEDIFLFQLQGKLKSTDLILAISGSGNSKNVLKACEYAKRFGCEIIGLTGYKGGKLAEMADINMHVNIDDMQITEDIHMSFDHMMMQILWRYLNSK